MRASKEDILLFGAALGASGWTTTSSGKIALANWPNGRAARVLNFDGGLIPKKAAHVVIANAPVREDAAETATASGELAPGTQVAVIEAKGDWTPNARDGKRVGYISTTALAPLQYLPASHHAIRLNLGFAVDPGFRRGDGLVACPMRRAGV